MGDGKAEGLPAVGDGGQAVFHPGLTLTAQVLVPCSTRCTFESLKVHNLKGHL